MLYTLGAAITTTSDGIHLHRASFRGVSYPDFLTSPGFAQDRVQGASPFCLQGQEGAGSCSQPGQDHAEGLQPDREEEGRSDGFVSRPG